MQNVFTAERTKLLDLYPVRMFFLILRSTVINTAAFGALKLDGFTHYSKIIVTKNLDIEIRFKGKTLFLRRGMKPPTGIEPVTSSLPRTCSTD